MPQDQPLSDPGCRRSAARHIVRPVRAGYHWPMVLFDLALTRVEYGPTNSVLAGAERITRAVQDVGPESVLELLDAVADQGRRALEADARMERLLPRKLE